MKRGFQIYLKDVRKGIFSKGVMIMIVGTILGAAGIKLKFPSISEIGMGTELIISSMFRLLLVYYGVNHFGCEYFTNTARLIYSVQVERLVIYGFKILANMTTAVYFAAVHILLKLTVPDLAGIISSVSEIWNILGVYLLFSIAVTVFSVTLSLIIKSSTFVLIADYFLFFWSLGDNLVMFGKNIKCVFLRSLLTHNTFYELGSSFATLHINQYTVKSAIPFILLFSVVGAVLLKRKDIA